MKSYLKTVRIAAFTAMLATLTLFSCKKQENVEPTPNQEVLDTETIVGASEAVVVGEKGKQIPLSEFKKQVASNANKSNARVVSGRIPVTRSLVEAYANSHRGSISQLSWIKQKYSDMFGRTTSHLDGVSFGEHQFGSGHNASSNQGWIAHVNYRFDKVGGVGTVETPWSNVTFLEISAPSNADLPIQQGGDFLRATKTEESSLTKTKTHGIDLGFSVEYQFTKLVKLTGSVNYSFSSAVATMTGESNSETIVVRYYGNLVIPRGKTCRLMLQTKEVETYQKYRAKTWFDGYVGGNYSRRVDGAYFWAHAASLFFDKAHNKYQEVTQAETYPGFRYILTNCR